MRDEVVAVPPTLHALRMLGANVTPDLIDRFLSIQQAHGVPERQITFRPNYICFPVRTPTRRRQRTPAVTWSILPKSC